MELRFRLKIQHSSVIDDTDVGHFSCELQDSHLQNGLFHFSEYGAVEMGEVLRLIETSNLTKGLRLRNRQIRFVCVLKQRAASENSEDAEDADEPYFCATIDTNGWHVLKAILDKQEVC